ncbi:hypothetical protein DAPPPG215_21315 [Pseudomonas syringae pv. tomato]|uniref:DUF1534 domain-containing protein n=1 Tax=Pseudomonas syringae pv. tomato TaxID=323 RepID=A0AAV1BRH3_PSEUB|nr:hypothetical protein DAPPPG215_21315 [Pseudomonas syringae pv. tomato]
MLRLSATCRSGLVRELSGTDSKTCDYRADALRRYAVLDALRPILSARCSSDL